MRNLVAAVVALAVLVSGCTGSFVLTKQVYDFHRSQPKWQDELLFLAAAILPVYGLAMAGDAIIFNTIEFWSGENPLDQEVDLSKSEVGVEGSLVLNYLSSGEVEISRNGESSLLLEKTGDGVVARNKDGEVICVSQKDDVGGISIYDREGNLMRRFSSRQVELAQRSLKD